MVPATANGFELLRGRLAVAEPDNRHEPAVRQRGFDRGGVGGVGQFHRGVTADQRR